MCFDCLTNIFLELLVCSEEESERGEFGYLIVLGLGGKVGVGEMEELSDVDVEGDVDDGGDLDDLDA